MFNIMVFLLIFSVTFSLQCSIPTFNNTLVIIDGRQEVITGCLSSNKLKFELKSQMSEIYIQNQSIPHLNRGAVQNILDKFAICLNYNNIEIIREMAFLNLPRVTIIDLSHNQINWIRERAFTDLPGLAHVNLVNNPLRIASRSFNNLKKLLGVKLDSCKLVNFDQSWFYNTPRLSLLSFVGNYLQTIPSDAFIDLPSIKILNFDNNKINHIDEHAFNGLSDLRLISLKKNRLKFFEINFHGNYQLKAIDLDFNNITYLSDIMVQTIESNLERISVIGNPLQCACLIKLIEWGIKNNVTVADTCPGQELNCAYPKSEQQQCVDRDDNDFYDGFWSNFEIEKNCPPSYQLFETSYLEYL